MWITEDTETIWVDMEQNSCNNVPVGALPFLTEKAQKGLGTCNEWIRATMKIWSEVRKEFKLSNSGPLK